MTEQSQEVKQKEKQKQIEEIIKKVKEILKQLHLNTFYKYREAGKEIIASGYDKGKWLSKYKKKAIEEWAISQQTFSIIVQLGELTDEEFTNAVSKFPSVQLQRRLEIRTSCYLPDFHVHCKYLQCCLIPCCIKRISLLTSWKLPFVFYP